MVGLRESSFEINFCPIMLGPVGQNGDTMMLSKGSFYDSWVEILCLLIPFMGQLERELKTAPRFIAASAKCVLYAHRMGMGDRNAKGVRSVRARKRR